MTITKIILSSLLTTSFFISLSTDKSKHKDSDHELYNLLADSKPDKPLGGAGASTSRTATTSFTTTSTRLRSDRAIRLDTKTFIVDGKRAGAYTFYNKLSDRTYSLRQEKRPGLFSKKTYFVDNLPVCKYEFKAAELAKNYFELREKFDHLKIDIIGNEAAIREVSKELTKLDKLFSERLTSEAY